MPLIRGCSTTMSHMVMKVLNNLMELKKGVVQHNF